MSINIETCLNLRVKIQTTINTSFQGTIYSYNPTAGLITLVLEDNSKSVILDKHRVENDGTSTPSNNTSKGKNYKILKTAFIKNIQLLSKKNSIKPPQHPLDIITQAKDIKPVRVANLSKHYETAERQYKEDFELNKILARQVTLKNHLGIEIYKKLYKILPKDDVKFVANNDILVFDNVLIKYPYIEVKYKDQRPDDDRLDHIKKIVGEAKAKGG